MATMPILKSGCYWRVGNGEDIRVRKEKWIPNYPSNKVLHPVAEEGGGMGGFRTYRLGFTLLEVRHNHGELLER